MAEKKLSCEWKVEDGRTREIQYLCLNNDFQFYSKNGCKGFMVRTKDGVKEYSEHARIIFHKIKEDEKGNITALLFNIIDENIWSGEDGTENEYIRYLFKKYSFVIDPDNFHEMYRVGYNGKYHSYPVGSQIKFFDIHRAEDGSIASLKFRVIVKEGMPIMPDNETTEEIKWLKKKYGFFYDCDAQMYRIREKNGDIKEYPPGIRILFHNREYDEDGTMYRSSFKIQQLKWV